MPGHKNPIESTERAQTSHERAEQLEEDHCHHDLACGTACEPPNETWSPRRSNCNLPRTRLPARSHRDARSFAHANVAEKQTHSRKQQSPAQMWQAPVRHLRKQDRILLVVVTFPPTRHDTTLECQQPTTTIHNSNHTTRSSLRRGLFHEARKPPGPDNVGEDRGADAEGIGRGRRAEGTGEREKDRGNRGRLRGLEAGEELWNADELRHSHFTPESNIWRTLVYDVDVHDTTTSRGEISMVVTDALLLRIPI